MNFVLIYSIAYEGSNVMYFSTLDELKEAISTYNIAWSDVNDIIEVDRYVDVYQLMGDE